MEHREDCDTRNDPHYPICTCDYEERVGELEKMTEKLREIGRELMRHFKRCPDCEAYGWGEMHHSECRFREPLGLAQYPDDDEEEE